MSKVGKPSPSYVRDIVSYNPDDGSFRWSARTYGFKSARDMAAWNTRYAGSSAGCKHKSGYVFITIADKHYAAAQIAWVIVNGGWPATDIDHINGDPSDNRYANLREATRSQNLANRGVQRNNSTGFKGVSFNVKTQRFYAQIAMNGERRHIGSFRSAHEAAAAYADAAKEMHKEFARF